MHTKHAVPPNIARSLLLHSPVRTQRPVSAYNMSPPPTPIDPPKIPLLERAHPPLKFARRHRVNITRSDPEYAHYKSAQLVALANAVNELWKELSARSAVQYMKLESETLMLRFYSQSKLSQQELADLQKATHFDKKELQQWYKGTRCSIRPLERR